MPGHCLGRLRSTENLVLARGRGLQTGVVHTAPMEMPKRERFLLTAGRQGGAVTFELNFEGVVVS